MAELQLGQPGEVLNQMVAGRAEGAGGNVTPPVETAAGPHRVPDAARIGSWLTLPPPPSASHVWPTPFGPGVRQRDLLSLSWLTVCRRVLLIQSIRCSTGGGQSAGGTCAPAGPASFLPETSVRWGPACQPPANLGSHP